MRSLKIVKSLFVLSFIGLTAAVSSNTYMSVVSQPFAIQPLSATNISGYNESLGDQNNILSYVLNRNYYSKLAENFNQTINSQEDYFKFNNQNWIYSKNDNFDYQIKDENNNIAILRNPKMAAFYYFNPYYVYKYGVSVLTSPKEINDFLFYYYSYNSSYKPILYSAVGIPLNFFSYVLVNGSQTYPFHFLFTTYNDHLVNILPVNITNSIPNLPNLIHYENGAYLSTNSSKYSDSQGESLFSLYLNNVNGISQKIFMDLLPTNTTFFFKETPIKANVLFTSILLPRGAIIDIPKEIRFLGDLNQNISGVTLQSLQNTLNEKYQAIYDVFKNKYFSQNTIVTFLEDANSHNSFFNSIENKINSIQGCVYYYKDKVLGQTNDGKQIILYTGKIIPNNVFFLANGNYSYLNGTNLIKFNKSKVYLCKNNQWIDLENNQQACQEFAQQYDYYNNLYWNGTCLLNELEENPVWFRKYNKNTQDTDENLNIKGSSKSYLDCIDENGQIIKNGQINNNYLCSAGVLTPIFNNLKKFYIKDYPQNVTFSFELSNFANQPIELIGFEVKGVPESWKFKVISENNKKKFEAGENFTLNLLMQNYEDDGSQKNITIKFKFKLADNKSNIPIEIPIPLRLQFSKEFLLKNEIKGNLIYDEQKGKTNNITLKVYYDDFGVLHNIPYCIYENGINIPSGNNICKYFKVNFTLPEGCHVVTFSPSQIKAENIITYPKVEFYCEKQITDNDKIKVCSDTIIKYYNNTGNVQTLDLCPNCDNKAHCEEISLKSTSYIKDFSLSSSYKIYNGAYYFNVIVSNTGNAVLKGTTIKLKDLTGNCNLQCLDNNCVINGNTLTWSNAQQEINIGDKFSKMFKLDPTGICKIDVKVTIDDPITKNMTVIINPYTEKEVVNYVKKDNPSLFPVLIILVSVVLLFYGLFKIKEELD